MKRLELLQQIVIDSKLRHKDIDYFDSHLFESYKKDNFVTVDQYIYYRDVYLFIASAKTIAATRGSNLVRTQLHTYFRDIV